MMCDMSDDELDQLFESIEMGEPDSNNNSIPYVRLFMAVRSPTEELESGASLALVEGGNWVWHPEGGSGQKPSISPIRHQGEETKITKSKFSSLLFSASKRGSRTLRHF